jgi:hypothetical protein
MPQLLSARTPVEQVVVGNLVPCLFGALTGLVLGVSSAAYLLLNLLAVVGGYLAGLEHLNAREGALRGVAGGLQFGTFILLVHEVTGADPRADLPHPAVVLVVLTTGIGALLGALGGRSRGRRAGAPPAALEVKRASSA